MTLKDKIISDMTAAMKAKDAARTSTLRMVKAAIMHREKEGGGELTDEDVTKLLRSQVKQRRDSVEQYQKAGRQELVDDVVDYPVLAHCRSPSSRFLLVTRRGWRAGSRQAGSYSLRSSSTAPESTETSCTEAISLTGIGVFPLGSAVAPDRPSHVAICE